MSDFVFGAEFLDAGASRWVGGVRAVQDLEGSATKRSVTCMTLSPDGTITVWYSDGTWETL